jgi:hypothetical protein
MSVQVPTLCPHSRHVSGSKEKDEDGAQIRGPAS